MIPNLISIVEKTKSDYPRAWSKCHHPGDPEAHDFIILVARRCYNVNPSFGLNGKRGGDDLSWDAMNWRGDADDSPNVIDCVAGAGGSNPQPAWIVTNTTGKFFNPNSYNTYYNYGSTPIVPTPPSSGLTREEVQAMINASISAAMVDAVKYGQNMALQSNSGAVLCAEGGGPHEDYQPFDLASRSQIGAWETWKIHRGE